MRGWVVGEPNAKTGSELSGLLVGKRILLRTWVVGIYVYFCFGIIFVFLSML